METRPFKSCIEWGLGMHRKGRLALKIPDARRQKNEAPGTKVLPFWTKVHSQDAWKGIFSETTGKACSTSRKLFLYSTVTFRVNLNQNRTPRPCTSSRHNVQQCPALSSPCPWKADAKCLEQPPFCLTGVLPTICTHNGSAPAIWSKRPSFRHCFSWFTWQFASYFIWPYRQHKLNR